MRRRAPVLTLFLVSIIVLGSMMFVETSSATHCTTPIIFDSYYRSSASSTSLMGAPCYGGYITPGANTFEVRLQRAKDPNTNWFICDPTIAGRIEFDAHTYSLSWAGCSASSSGIGYHYFHPINIEGPDWPMNTMEGHEAIVTVCTSSSDCDSITYRTVRP